MTTPKPTAEERARSCVVSNEVVSHPMNINDVVHQIEEATRKAFEEAAEEIDATPDAMFDSRYQDGWRDATVYYKAAIRALAKEKPARIGK